MATTVRAGQMSRRARWTLVVIAGVLCGLAQPCALPVAPASLLLPGWLASLLAFIGPAPLILACHDLRPRRAYLVGFVAFAIQFCIVFYWMAIPIVVHGHQPPWVGVGGVVGVTCLLAAVLAVVPALARLFEDHWGLHRIVSWPVAWTAVELVRNAFPFGGFPWGAIGASQAQNPVVLQIASLAGVYGLTALVVAAAASLAHLFIGPGRGRDRVARVLGGATLASLLIALFGLWRLSWLDDVQAQAPHLRVAILQGNIAQEMKNKAQQHRWAILQKYQLLTRQAQERGARLVVWPEAAYPGFFERSSRTLAGRGFGDTDSGAFTAAGVVFYWRPAVPGQPTVMLHNSLVVLDPDHAVLGTFHKRHLVPFGERVPWPLGSIMRRLVPGVGMIQAGEEAPLVEVDGALLGGLICYEGIFPQYSRRFAQRGANLLVNVTNDAWYGYSSAPHQHVASYALRAVETGRSVVRAANTGVSALFGPDGIPRGTSGLFVDAVVVEDAPLVALPTLYVRTGDLFAWLCLAAALGLLGSRLVRRAPNRLQP